MSRAGLTIVPFVPCPRPPRSTAKFLPRCVDVWAFERGQVQCRPKRNVTSTKKRLSVFLGEEKCTPRENRGYAYEKRAPPYVGMGSRPRMVNPALHMSYEEPVAKFMRMSIIVRDSFCSFAFHRQSELYCGLNDCLTVCFFILFFISLRVRCRRKKVHVRCLICWGVYCPML